MRDVYTHLNSIGITTLKIQLMVINRHFYYRAGDRELGYLKKSDTITGGNLFYSCISRAVYLSDETWRIVGKINENGVRHEGLIDKYARDISIEDAIAKVASDTEVSGDETLAGQLYMAASVSFHLH